MNWSERRRRAVAAVAGIVVLLASPLASRAADEVDINVILPLTGPAAFLGKAGAESLQLVEKSVNASGGIRGRPVKFVVVDDQTNPQLSVQLGNAIFAKNPGIVLGPSMVSGCNALYPLVKSGGPVVYCLSPGMHPDDGSYMFSSNISTAQYMTAVLRFLRGKGWRRIAVITSSDGTGQDADRVIDGALAEPANSGGVTVVDREHFNTIDVSTSAQMAHIKASTAQAAIFWTNGTPLGTLLRDAYQANLGLPIVTSGGNMNADQLSGYASFVPSELYLMSPAWGDNAHLAPGTVRTASDAYLAAFRAAGYRPDQSASDVWDAATLAVEALRKFGPDASAEQIRTYIAGLRNRAGVNGLYDYTKIPQRGIGIDWVVIVRWDPDHHAFVGASKPGGIPL
jgi:branched-chain amino acid transport system substrate-binding protein